MSSVGCNDNVSMRRMASRLSALESHREGNSEEDKHLESLADDDSFDSLSDSSWENLEKSGDEETDEGDGERVESGWERPESGEKNEEVDSAVGRDEYLRWRQMAKALFGGDYVDSADKVRWAWYFGDHLRPRLATRRNLAAREACHPDCRRCWAWGVWATRKGQDTDHGRGLAPGLSLMRDAMWIYHLQGHLAFVDRTQVGSRDVFVQLLKACRRSQLLEEFLPKLETVCSTEHQSLLVTGVSSTDQRRATQNIRLWTGFGYDFASELKTCIGYIVDQLRTFGEGVVPNNFQFWNVVHRFRHDFLTIQVHNTMGCQREKCLSLCSEAIQCSPTDPWFLSTKVYLLLKLDRLSSCEEDCKVALGRLKNLSRRISCIGLIHQVWAESLRLRASRSISEKKKMSILQQAIKQFDKAAKYWCAFSELYVYPNLQELLEVAESCRKACQMLEVKCVSVADTPRHAMGARLQPEAANLPKAEAPGGVLPWRKENDEPRVTYQCALASCAVSGGRISLEVEWGETICSQGCHSRCHKNCLRSFRRLNPTKCPSSGCSGESTKQSDVYMTLATAEERRIKLHHRGNSATELGVESICNQTNSVDGVVDIEQCKRTGMSQSDSASDPNSRIDEENVEKSSKCPEDEIMLESQREPDECRHAEPAAINVSVFGDLTSIQVSPNSFSPPEQSEDCRNPVESYLANLVDGVASAEELMSHPPVQSLFRSPESLIRWCKLRPATFILQKSKRTKTLRVRLVETSRQSNVMGAPISNPLLDTIEQASSSLSETQSGTFSLRRRDFPGLHEAVLGTGESLNTGPFKFIHMDDDDDDDDV
uniref:Uncharacterized protein n=1 Tax=Compsopogon caeruleus TaxID=31354 RepID=A0A7S1XG01_9RHOD